MEAAADTSRSLSSADDNIGEELRRTIFGGVRATAFREARDGANITVGFTAGAMRTKLRKCGATSEATCFLAKVAPLHLGLAL